MIRKTIFLIRPAECSSANFILISAFYIGTFLTHLLGVKSDKGEKDRDDGQTGSELWGYGPWRISVSLLAPVSRCQRHSGACPKFDKSIKSCPRREWVVMGHCVWTTQMIQLCFRDSCCTPDQSWRWPVLQIDYSLPHNLSYKWEMLSFIYLSSLLMAGACTGPSTNRIILDVLSRLRKARRYWRTALMVLSSYEFSPGLLPRLLYQWFIASRQRPDKSPKTQLPCSPSGSRHSSSKRDNESRMS